MLASQIDPSPKVSVCVTTYNQEKLIGQCLESIVQQQADFPFEILVGDDCSTDGTQDVIRSYAARYPQLIRLFLFEQNNGSTHNYQTVHHAARGEYVAHCDGDDYFLPGKLQRQVAYLDANKEVVQCWHRMRLVDGNDQVIGEVPKRYTPFLQKKLSLKDLALAYFSVGFHSSQMYRRAAKTEYSRKQFTIDYFFALDIGSRGLSAHMPDFLGCYRTIPNNSLTTSVSSMNKVDEAVAEAAEYFTARQPALGPVFYGNLWFRRLLIRYAGNRIPGKYADIFRKFNKYKSKAYAIRSTLLYISMYSDFKFKGLQKKLFRRRRKRSL